MTVVYQEKLLKFYLAFYYCCFSRIAQVVFNSTTVKQAMETEYNEIKSDEIESCLSYPWKPI